MLHAVMTRMELCHDRHVAPLKTAEMIHDWEINFMNSCVTPVVADLHQKLATYREQLAGIERDKHQLEYELKEMTDLTDRNARQIGLARLWRYTSSITSAEDAMREMCAFTNRDPD